jgi:8-oxo-dGTP diphosphatase
MNPVEAAGGILMRRGRTPLFAIVQRRKDNAWVLPKGKLKPRESAVAAARREVVEETGHGARVHEYLGAISYKAGRRPKIVAFWRMQETTGSTRDHAPDIKAVEWLSLDAAVTRLTQPLERAFLAEVGARAVKSMRLAEVERTPRKLATRIAKKRPVTNGAHLDAPTKVTLPAPKESLLRRLFGQRATAETTGH